MKDRPKKPITIEDAKRPLDQAKPHSLAPGQTFRAEDGKLIRSPTERKYFLILGSIEKTIEIKSQVKNRRARSHISPTPAEKSKLK